MPSRFASRFDEGDDPMASMGNLVDLMLVFACGLIAALLSRSPMLLEAQQQQTTREVKQGTELANMPESSEAGGKGLESVGTVFRDPKTGKLLLVGE